MQNWQATAPLFDCNYIFPEPCVADPKGLGLIAIGADLSPQTLLCAYSQGLFPWFNEDEPIAWWSPEPRCVLKPTYFIPSRSLKRLAKSSTWHWSVNNAFEEVIHACSLPRSYTEDTWIHDEMIQAYIDLHELGYAHSFEVWDDKTLIGGLYGLKIGQIYFGESMFHRQSNASKVAFWALNNFCQHTQVQLIDCQLPNPHLKSLGAGSIPRETFLLILKDLVAQKSKNWCDFSSYKYQVNQLPKTLIP
ncbi:leucyl/phenylalanyl-tRNA--protein transferase [Psychrobacter sp.]|uniref:leucyl/phenylalanyl-tRNA--protein transferase n=1 Tax=Psychrobacter sp. TaxID=56811 RepID=UPI0025D3744F|nr:leucyl/phenylalanyl-tRNA--protein transferase [Psychrobacter sp.]